LESHELSKEVVDLLLELNRSNPEIVFAGLVAKEYTRSQNEEVFLLDSDGLPLIHSTAWIGEDVVIGPGAAVLAGARITTNVRISANCVIGLNAVVSHDCRIGQGVIIGHGALLNGNVFVEAQSKIGSGAVIIPGCTIGEGSTVLDGAVVLRSVPKNVVVAGCPAKTVGTLGE
jgi:acetyltransferase EpsM